MHCRFLGGRRCGGQRPLRVWLDIIRHCTSLVWVPPWQEREHGPQGVTNQRSRQSWPWHGLTAEGLGRWEQLLGVEMLNSGPRLDTQTRSLRCVPEPQSEEHSAQGPVNQRQVSSQGPKLQARMSVGRLPGVQLCMVPPAPASAGPVPSASPLPRQTTERRWIPVPHSAEHLVLQSLWNQAVVQGPMSQGSLLGGRGGPKAHSCSLTSSPLSPTQRTCRFRWPRPHRTEHLLQGDLISQWPQRRSWQAWVTLGRGRWPQRSGGTDDPPVPNSWRQSSWRCWVPGPQERLHDVHSPASQYGGHGGPWQGSRDTGGLVATVQLCSCSSSPDSRETQRKMGRQTPFPQDAEHSECPTSFQ